MIEHPLIPTMSKASLLLACQYPWRRHLPVVPVGEPAHYGSAFHAVMAEALGKTWWKERVGVVLNPKYALKASKQFGVDREELSAHANHAFRVLHDWIRGDNPWGVDLSGARRRVEISLAYNVKTGQGRRIAAPDKDHVYHDAGKHDLPGTADLVLDMIPDKARRKGVPHFIILDHKTGEEFDPPLESAQLLSLGLAYRGIVPYVKREIALAVFHSARNDSPPTVYVDEVEPATLGLFASRLKRAWRRIGDGSLVPGPHCQRCPAMTTCPAYANALVTLKPTGAMTSAQIGKIHQALGVYNAFAKKISDEIVRPWVRQHGPSPRPDGKVVILSPYEEERVAKKYVIEAEGEEGAEAVFEEWRKKGYLKKSESERLLAVWDK
jgi:PD-(D/E)XK nuclease superfamily